MQTEELRRERRPGGEGKGDNAALFCCGDPGVSKIFIRYHNMDYSPARKERELVLDSCDGSSLAMDKRFDQAGGKNTGVRCFLL